MDKIKLLSQDEERKYSKSNFGMKVVGFCFCVIFLGSILLNVYYLRNMIESRESGVAVADDHIKDLKINIEEGLTEDCMDEFQASMRRTLYSIQGLDRCQSDRYRCAWRATAFNLYCTATDEDNWLQCLLNGVGYECADCLCAWIGDDQSFCSGDAQAIQEDKHIDGKILHQLKKSDCYDYMEGIYDKMVYYATLFWNNYDCNKLCSDRSASLYFICYAELYPSVDDDVLAECIIYNGGDGCLNCGCDVLPALSVDSVPDQCS